MMCDSCWIPNRGRSKSGRMQPKWAQKRPNKRKRAQTQVRKRVQKSAKGRKRAQKSVKSVKNQFWELPILRTGFAQNGSNTDLCFWAAGSFADFFAAGSFAHFFTHFATRVSPSFLREKVPSKGKPLDLKLKWTIAKWTLLRAPQIILVCETLGDRAPNQSRGCRTTTMMTHGRMHLPTFKTILRLARSWWLRTKARPRSWQRVKSERISN